MERLRALELLKKMEVVLVPQVAVDKGWGGYGVVVSIADGIVKVTGLVNAGYVKVLKLELIVENECLGLF